ncbi:DUF2199 domain-containing protein [Massilia sp. PAMC28688]|uniref:DUF2199 domain-containing protein n=1 Tax=Massilia sp. PAMC28688 TaxID=2861283 RepID=UPI001C627075|nr:DUF2199 domain-containing protein [Massilia sp. PAMC28688]QYF93860.1 DUF2199 domain-containing protein [Massilia sp. PAMC28688]
MVFECLCSGCGEVHQGMPAFGANAPLSYYAVPVHERQARCQLDSDSCVIDQAQYFVRCCLEIPVLEEAEPLSWGVWVSLSEQSYQQWAACFDADTRSHIGPFFGWLNAALGPYPDTVNLKTRVHLRDGRFRPYVELEPNCHPLAIEQREGISVARVAQLYAAVVHPVEGCRHAD